MHRPPGVMVPTAGHARRALVFALRHIAEAERRRACAAVFSGISNRRAVELVRQLLRGLPDNTRISLLTWQVVRTLGNAPPHTASKAWWNAERWQLPDTAVRVRLDALRRGDA